MSNIIIEKSCYLSDYIDHALHLQRSCYLSDYRGHVIYQTTEVMLSIRL